LGKALNSSELARNRFRVEGQADTVGGAAYNKRLSERRAEAVVDYLTRRFGVQPKRLEAEGMGAAGLEVPTPPQTPDPRNRRVQVVNLGA
jgi:OmpA-OmpF porin, OOP family